MDSTQPAHASYSVSQGSSSVAKPSSRRGLFILAVKVLVVSVLHHCHNLAHIVTSSWDTYKNNLLPDAEDTHRMVTTAEMTFMINYIILIDDVIGCNIRFMSSIYHNISNTSYRIFLSSLEHEHVLFFKDLLANERRSFS